MLINENRKVPHTRLKRVYEARVEHTPDIPAAAGLSREVEKMSHKFKASLSNSARSCLMIKFKELEIQLSGTTVLAWHDKALALILNITCTHKCPRDVTD